MRRRVVLSLLAAQSVGLPARAGDRAATLIFPLHDPSRTALWRYHEALLRAALKRAGADYEIAESPLPMTQARVLRELADASGTLDLAWTMTSAEREAQLRPVRVPLDRGLIGYRLSFVRPEHADRWADVRTLQQLQPFVAGQGLDWPDTQILRANGLAVRGATRETSLFDMLRAGRVDYFPRGAFEVDGELASGAAEGLVVEPHVLLRYPAASYFFVRRDRPALGAELQRGLDAMAADGSFARLFLQHFGELVQRHRLRQRTVLSLRNPLLPPDTPLGHPGYWFLLDG